MVSLPTPRRTAAPPILALLLVATLSPRSATAGSSTSPRPARGGSIVIDAARQIAFIADADNKAIQRVDLASRTVTTTPLGCLPEQVLLLPGDRVAVSLRDCNEVVLLRDGGELSVIGRATVPDDPWGLSATAAGDVLVTSAFGHALTALDGNTLERRWSVDLPREPRAVVVAPDGGRAFVSHLVGGSLSVISLLGGSPEVHAVTGLKASFRNRIDEMLGAATLHPTAALGYSAVLSESGTRLYLPHVVEQNGAEAVRVVPGSYGGVAIEEETTVATVAVLAVKDESLLGSPAAPSPSAAALATADAPPADAKDTSQARLRPAAQLPKLRSGAFLGMVPTALSAPARQARAAAVFGDSLLVASQGTDELVEMDARAPDPALAVRRIFPVGAGPRGVDVDPARGTAYVWSQFAHALTVIDLRSGSLDVLAVSADPLPPEVAAGRLLFHTERDRRVSRDGRACAGCHPEGRDDGVVWHLGVGPRQTPTLVGRLDHGPFGWEAKHADLQGNMSETMGRLGGTGLPKARLDELAAFLRRGLGAPRRAAVAGAAAARGRELFVSEEVGCSGCHSLDREGSDRERHDVVSQARREQTKEFRTPPLLFVGGTAPYFHDGRYPTLEALLDDNLDRMGRTSQLSPGDVEALAAFLRTL